MFAINESIRQKSVQYVITLAKETTSSYRNMTETERSEIKIRDDQCLTNCIMQVCMDGPREH